MTVSFQAKSSAAKLSPTERVPYFGPGRRLGRTYRPMPRRPFVSSTYASIKATCSPTCLFYENGCFASEGFTKRMMKRLDDEAREENVSGFEVALNEAMMIDVAFGAGPIPQDGGRDGVNGRDLRLHVGGDVADTNSTRALSDAAKRWRERGGGAVWTYTHRWKTIRRAAWGGISVLASVETVADAQLAIRRGYVPAIVVESFASDRAFTLPGIRGWRFVPCPYETRQRTCVECRLCLDAERLRALKLGIAFAIHGYGASKVRHHLLVMS